MYMPKFLVTQAQFDAASEEERKSFNYVVVPDEPIPLPKNFCFPQQERDSAEKRTKPAPLN